MKTTTGGVSVGFHVATPSMQGTIELSMLQQLMDGCLIVQKPAIRGEIILPRTELGYPKAWYMDEKDGQVWHYQELDFSGREAELSYPPNGDVDITVIYRTDPQGVPQSGSSVGGGGASPVSLKYDPQLRKLVAVGGEFYGKIVVSYFVSYKVIRYKPASIQYSAAGLSTGGSRWINTPFWVKHYEPLPNQTDASGCEQGRLWLGKFDVSGFDFSGQEIQIAAVTRKFILWEERSFELPPDYPNNLHWGAGTQGSPVDLPDPDDKETWEFPTEHVVWTMDDYSGAVRTKTLNPALHHPYAPQLWENSSFIPKFSFERSEPSGEHAKTLFNRVDWDNIIAYVRKTFPDCEGV